ncbi:MAG: putative cytokinetic ring protein SteA [Streptosporangiaceae bacterium]|jgi:uncharacterized membrane-anchored protein
MKAWSRKLPGIRRSRSHDLPGISATARLDHRTKNLTKRLQPGDIAIIDHADLDRVSAEALIRRQAAAVVNAAPSISGRYPNLGPQLLVEAGVPLVDDVGPDVFDRVSEGQQVRLDGETVYLGAEIVAKGTLQDGESVAAAMEEARAGLADQLKAFAANTLEYISRDSELLIHGIAVPELRLSLEGRHALVVARGYRHRDDLQALRAYIREFKPVMVAVDGGANALMDAGYKPDLIVGDMDSVSDKALKCGAELVVHAYPNGVAPGLARVQDLGLASVLCPATGTSEDLAVLLADEMGATLIVAVGMRFSMAEFLDKGRAGMASAVLTRMRVGDKIVDAKGVSRLYRSRISGWALIVLVLAASVALVVALAFSTAGPILSGFLATKWDDFIYRLTGLL